MMTCMIYSPGNELLERLSSSLESALNVDTDLADPELTDPLPEIEYEFMNEQKYFFARTISRF